MISKIAINGSDLLFRRWAVPNSLGQVLIVHGYAEHSGRYEETAQKLNDKGIDVIAFDRKGEGASEGKKAYIHEMSDQIKDVYDIINNHIPKDKKTFIYGHSLGGLITTKFILDYQPDNIAGVVLSGPLLKVDEDLSPLLQKMAGVIGRLLPTLPTVKVESKFISRDPEVVEAYNNDPYVYRGATKARTGFQILKTTEEILDKFQYFKHPVLVIHGGADKLADPSGSENFIQNCQSSDKELMIMEGLYHEIMREPEKEQFFNKLTSWISARI